MQKLHTVEQIAEAAQVAPSKVYEWIRSGELRALNLVSDTHRKKRPIWRIRRRDWELFEAERMHTARRRGTRAERKVIPLNDVPDYFAKIQS